MKDLRFIQPRWEWESERALALCECIGTFADRKVLSENSNTVKLYAEELAEMIDAAMVHSIVRAEEAADENEEEEKDE